MAVIKGGFEIVKRAMLKELMKRGDDGIMLTLPKNEIVDLNARITMDRLIKAGIDPESLTSPDQVLNVLENINNQIINNARVIPGTSAEGKAITEKLFGKKGEVVDMTGKKIDTSQGIMGGKSVKELMESGQVQKGTDDIKISDKITEREMFKNSNLNKKDSVTETISYIKTLEPIDAMKEANSVIGRKGKYKNLTPEESKKILQDTEDHIFERDIPDEDFAKGGRAGYAVGNQVMPEVDARMKNTYEQNIKLNQIQRNMQDRVRKGSKTQGLEIGQLTEGMYGKPKTEYNLYNPNLKFNEAQSYGAASNMGLRPEQIKAVAYYNTLKNNFGDQGIGMAGPSMGLAQVGGLAPGTNPFGSEKFFKTPAEQFALYQEGLRQQALQGSPEIYFDADKTYDTGDYVSPKGIYTFRDDEFLRNLYNNNNTMVVDGKEYASEQDAIDDMGIERYNQFMAKGGRAGYYTGGMVDVEPNLSDIGHGSDALMARTRLVAPDSQATTSTGLNYLLAEDNDNIRVPFKNGFKVYPKIMASKRNINLGDGKNVDLQDLTYGGTLMYDKGPFSAGIEYLKGKDKFDFKDKDLTLDKDTTDRELANLILMMKLKDGSIKFKGNKDDQMINFSKSFADGGRIGFSKGKGVDLLRRGFLKTMGAAGAGIAALKTGLLGIGGKQATKEVAKEIITTPAAAGKPAWFDALVTRVVNEGEDVTKKFATKDREIVHATKVDDDAMVTVYRDLDDGTVRVDVSDATRNVADDQGEAIVSMEVRGGQLEEGVKGKTPVEFEAREVDYRNYMDGPDDYTTETIDNVVGDTKDLTADLTKVKMYAKGQKKPTIKEMMIQRDRAKTLKQAEENPAEYAADRGPDIDTKDYDYASGGIARMIGE